MVKKEIGTKLTNSKGRAYLDYSATGVGKIQIFAETDVTDTKKKLITAPLEMYDVLFRDLSVGGSYTDWKSDSNFTVDRSNGIEAIVTPTNSSAFAQRYVDMSTYSKRPITIEFDFNLSFEANGGSSIISIRNGTTSKGGFSPNSLGLKNGEYSHIKITIDDNTVSANVDGEDKHSFTHDGTFNRFYFTQNANYDWQIRYRNFIIY